MQKGNLLRERFQNLVGIRTVCRKYYVHPVIIDLYAHQKLHKYLVELDALEKKHDKTGLAAEEQLLLKILEKEGLILT